jgi:metal-responsive CopG/Arc/MetJ family transcriptional regulator
MLEVTISIPDQFLQTLDELVAQAPGVGSREEWVKNLVRNFILDVQTKRELEQKYHLEQTYQQIMSYLMTLWP